MHDTILTDSLMLMSDLLTDVHDVKYNITPKLWFNQLI